MCGEADFDIAEAFTAGKLSKRHRQKLFPTGQSTDTAISIVVANATAKVFVIDEGYDL
jgi:hypothetical protein